MKENAEYCTCQVFSVVFATTFFRLWQCKQCAYSFPQRITEREPPAIPRYHPQPLTRRFTVSEEQKARLTERLGELMDAGAITINEARTMKGEPECG